MTDDRSFFLSALVTELRHMRAELSALGDLLAADESVVERHIVELQRFDGLVQGMEEMASALESLAAGAETKAIIECIRLDAVQARISRALMAA